MQNQNEASVRCGSSEIAVSRLSLLLWAGIAAAVCWTVADILLVGFVQTPERYPLLSQTLAPQLGEAADFAVLMQAGSPERLLWGVLPADAARTHGQGRFCSAVFRICAVAFGACRFLFYGHGCQGAAECRARRLSGVACAVPPFLPDAGGALDGVGRFDCGGMAVVADTDAAPQDAASACRRVVQSVAGRNGYCGFVQPVSAITRCRRAWRGDV